MSPLLTKIFYSTKFNKHVKIRGVIKKFSAWPSSVQNKIKIVFATYSSKAQNTTCTMWLLGYKYFVHFSGLRLFAFDVERGVTQCNAMTILTDSFVPLHALLFWLRIEVVDARFIVNELWKNFAGSHRYRSRISSETCVLFIALCSWDHLNDRWSWRQCPGD